ncbi:IS3 family transposase [Arthrobacter sp. efr-133-TYG-118]|uniref:IS3 family transposase n=1 Tax=Arthrobacter sp. efr-133-TYG-118 TaxID=3040279 RepID=UPI00254E3704|nr:IS3 family transposase [Arthrobacter sp. efr-133-TYG-118]
MSRKGNCLDNTMVESFFGHLKEEFYRRRHFASISEFVQELNTYIHWYNHARNEESLNILSPVQYRAQFGQSAAPALIDNRTAGGCT